MAMKRPAADLTTVAAKRQAVRPVAKALADVEDFPANLLTDVLPFSLGEFKSTREGCQETMVSAVGDALESIKKKKEAAVAEIDAQTKGLDADKAARIAAAKAAADPLPGLNAGVTGAAATLAAAKVAVKDAAKAVKDAIDAQKAGDADFDAATARKAELDTAQTSILAPMKEAKAVPKSVKALVAVSKKFGFDSTLVKSAHCALEKAPEARLPFDQVVMTQLDEAFSKAGADAAAEVAKLEPGKQEREAAVKAAEGALEAAKAKQEADTTALGEAKKALKEGEEKLAEAEAKVKSWLMDAKKLFEGLDSAKEDLEEFTAGPLATYAELKDREAPPPEPEEVEEPAAEEPPAEEPPAVEATAAE